MGKGFGINAQNVRFGKNFAAQHFYRLGHYSPAPILLGKVVAQLCGARVDVLLPEGTNAADRLAVNADGVGKGILRVSAEHCVYVAECVSLRVRVGQSVS